MQTYGIEIASKQPLEINEQENPHSVSILVLR